jgi:hypothetical protein
MKLGNASLNRRTSVPGDHASDYQATHQGPLNILGEGRPTVTWSRVSPAILGDIDHYVQALARR